MKSIGAGFLAALLFPVTLHAMIACRAPQRCTTTPTGLLVVLPGGMEEGCPKPLPKPGVYKDKTALWTFDAPPLRMCMGPVYLSPDASHALVVTTGVEGTGIDVYEKGKLLVSIGWRDVEIRMTDPGKLAVDIPPRFDGNINYESNDARGFVLSNGKGGSFRFDWHGKRAS